MQEFRRPWSIHNTTVMAVQCTTWADCWLNGVHAAYKEETVITEQVSAGADLSIIR